MWRIAFIPLIFAAATAALLYLVASMPQMEKKEVPADADDDVIISGIGWLEKKFFLSPFSLTET